MSYLVLARRWRPQKFADLVGQDVVVRTLKNALTSGNLAHAYLLCGIRGVGKTTIARLMAMAINCESPVSAEPCGQCSACQGIANGSNLDVQELDAASHTGVDDIREILDGVRYPPTTLKTKVYIIDEAHMLSKSAFNALLKTLEEPPARVMFILATTETDKLPVTVRSRCQRFDLRRLGQNEIADYLNHVFATESIKADADAVAAMSRAADGSVRDALSLAERVLAYAENHLNAENVEQALGLVGGQSIRMLSEAVFAGNAAEAVNVMRSAIVTGHAPRTMLLELARLWHQLACLQVNASILELELDAGQRSWLENHTNCLETQALDMRYQVLLHGIRDLALVDECMGAEMVLMLLCGLNAISAVTPATAPLPATLPDTEKSAAQKESAPEHSSAKTEKEAEAASPNLPLHEQPDVAGKSFASWQQAVDAFGAIKPGISAMLEHVICLEFGPKVRLALDEHKQRAIAATDRLAFAEWLGREVFWESQQGHSGESLSEERSRQARAEAARLRKNAEDDPHVQSIMKEMDAQLIKVLPAGVEDAAG